jgi:signal transduction histidine kinase
MCLLWRPGLLLLHILSDALIALSYYSIPAALAYFAAKRADLRFRWIFLWFGAFILACGTTHIMAIWTVWHPDYRAEGFVKLFTALASVGAAIVLWPLIPALLKIPSPSALEQANARLHSEIAERARHEQQAILLSDNLEKIVRERTQALLAANARLEREILERRQIEAALRDGDRRKDEFLATLAHELRNPLAPIRNAVELLKLQPGRVEQARELIGRQLRHLTLLVDDLLDVARITHGQVTLKKIPVGLADIVGQAVETARPTIDARGHYLDVFLPASPLPLEADPVRLAQAVANLLDNAAKYTEPGGQIALCAERMGDQAVITVADSGVGIAPERLPGVFDLFARGDRPANLAQAGLGLGLTLARRLVEMHHGSVEAFSEGAGRGSRFVVRLPLAERPAQAY